MREVVCKEIIKTTFKYGKKKKIEAKVGMIVSVPLINGKYSAISMIAVRKHEEGVYNIIWGFYDIIIDDISQLDELVKNTPEIFCTPFMICGMTYHDLETGRWKVIATLNMNLTNVDLDDESLRKQHYDVIRPGIPLLEMYLGIRPWNEFYDPEYLDKILLKGFSKPERAWYK